MTFGKQGLSVGGSTDNRPKPKSHIKLDQYKAYDYTKDSLGSFYIDAKPKWNAQHMQVLNSIKLDRVLDKLADMEMANVDLINAISEING